MIIDYTCHSLIPNQQTHKNNLVKNVSIPKVFSNLRISLTYSLQPKDVLGFESGGIPAFLWTHQVSKLSKPPQGRPQTSRGSILRENRQKRLMLCVCVHREHETPVYGKSIPIYTNSPQGQFKQIT